MRWLLIGVLMNGLALIPYSLVQAANRPDLTAKFHIAEVPIYFLALFMLVPRFGVAGAAVAWTLRVTLDAAALFVAAAIILPTTKAVIVRIIGLATLASFVIGIGAFLPGLDYRIVYVSAILSTFALIGWRSALDADERALLLQRLAGLKVKLSAASETA